MAFFRSFDSCTIVENLICYAGFLVHLCCFYHCTLRKLVKQTQVQTGSPGFYLPCYPEKFSKFRHENTWFAFRKKSSEVLYLLSLFSAGIYWVKVWLKRSQNGYFFSFPFLKWHIIVQTNRNNKLFLKDEHSYTYSAFGVSFLPGAAYYAQKLLLPVNERRKLPIRLIYKNKKLNVKRVLLNWKIFI